MSADVLALRPDYRALLLVATGLVPGQGEAGAEALLRRAEAHAITLLEDRPVEELAHVASWREAYRAFGAKPQRTRNSLEALTRRAPSGLPRVNPLTDVYNAISVLHQVPVGGEDLDAYRGSPRLVRADGTEAFDATSDGQEVLEHPEVGEVVWCDDAGVTCRRWNWRQGRRTALRADTTSALFIVDALDAVSDADLRAVATSLSDHLRDLGPDVRVAERLIGRVTRTDRGEVPS
ncbi:B3/B4 domain-containing protein [Phycicoccus avicenniae]|uniref:B3/B4 domain-containing protein n=1 Tax=Phycicoccus avicenniae TaxID=2828860 RepID=UPI003D28C5E2